MNFDELGLNEELLEAISYMGFTEATPIQAEAIPKILAGKDLIACAQTGTGKTAAFLLPILNKIVERKKSGTHTLIIAPTRELAIQIDQQIQGLSYFVSVGSQLIYGGGDAKDWAEQKEALVEGRAIIVATPGKLISHLKMGYVDFSNLENLILDEADRMLDMGFYDDIMTIISHLPKERQNLLFSATMPKEIKQLANRMLRDPEEIVLKLSKPAEGIKQGLYLLYDHQKTSAILESLKKVSDDSLCLIFCSTKRGVTEVVKTLKSKGFDAHGFSSDFDQDKREDVLRAFRARKIRIMVATDVVSRGIDIKYIDMVINYNVPSDAEDYVHRIGRTARAKKEGEAITLVNPEDVRKLRRIENLIEKRIPMLELPESLGETPSWPKHKSKHENKKGGSNSQNRQNNKPQGKKSYHKKKKFHKKKRRD